MLQFFSPCPPGPPLSIGDDAIETYCETHANEPVFEVENHLYHTEKLSAVVRPGEEPLCKEAVPVVRVLQDQIDLRFFNTTADTRNILRCPAVLESCVVFPGGGRLLCELAREVGDSDPTERTLHHLRQLCEKLHMSSPPPSHCKAQTLSPTTPSERRRARSCLLDFCAKDDAENAAAQTAGATAKKNLEDYVNMTDVNKRRDPLAFLMANKAKFLWMSKAVFSMLWDVVSSAGCELASSQAGSIMRQTRTSLLPRHLKMHTLIHNNAHLLPSKMEVVSRLIVSWAAKLREQVPLGRRSQRDGEHTSSDDGEE